MTLSKSKSETDEIAAERPKRRRRLKCQGAFFAAALVASVVATSSVPISALEAPANTYVAASVVDGVPTPTSPLSESDCALVIQMTGTIASGLGVYEILDPATSTPERSYSASEAVQFVVLPGGCDQVIDVDTTYVPPAWNPATGTGGVVFLGGSTLNLNADINASSAGFASNHSVGAGCDGGEGLQRDDGSFWEGGAGGGGIIGGGGGAAGHVALLFTWAQDWEFDAAPGGGGTATTAGVGGPNGDSLGSAPSGGSPDCVGNGGSQNQTVVSGNFFAVGAGGGGGGSYGGGGGACSSRSSGAYSAGGGGGGSYTGGGAGGWEGTNTGHVSPNDPGIPGNAPVATEITSASHYLNDEDARLIMGGAGGASFLGDGSGPAAGGNGGGVVVLAFDSVVGGGGSVISNGGDGSTPTNFGSDGSHGSSGSGGGAGGQIAIYAPSVSSTQFSAMGGIGGDAVEDSSSNTGLRHTGSAGASGGGGAIWFAGVGVDTTNSGPNVGASSATTSLAAEGLSNVDWIVSGGNPALGSFPAGVSIGGQTYDAGAWAAIVGAANLDSQATFKPIAVSLVDASNGGFTLEELVAAFPSMAQPDNPKNLGLGCGPGLGGDGLALTSAEIPLSTITTGTAVVESAPVAEPVEPPAERVPAPEPVATPPAATFSIGNQVWMDSNNDGVIDEGEMPVAGVDVQLFAVNSDGAIDPASPIATALTNDEGLYLFDELPAGDYVVGIGPAAFGETGPLANKIPSTPTADDPNTDIDADNNGVADTEIGFVLSGALTLGDGEPVAEDPSNDSATADVASNLTVDFGFYEVDLDVDVELTVTEEPDAGTVEVGDTVTFEVTVTNEGNVAADSVEVVVDLSEDFEPVIDPDWEIDADGATFEVPGTVEPGETTTAQITARVAGPELEAMAVVSEARAIDEEGVPITSVLGVSISNEPVQPGDSNPIVFTFAAAPASAATTTAPATAAAANAVPPVLAFTGVESSELALIALLLLATGGALVFFGDRRRTLVNASDRE